MDSVDVIEMKVPNPKTHGIYLSNIESNKGMSAVKDDLVAVCNDYGLVHSFKLHPKSKEPGCQSFRALASFYSQKAAKNALTKFELNGEELKVNAPSTDNWHYTPEPLPLGKAYDVLDYYLGFNSWSKEVMKLEKKRGKPGTIKFGCVLEVRFCQQPVVSEGLGIGEFSFKPGVAGGRIKAAEAARKAAHNNALQHAFCKVLLLQLPSGKVWIEVNNLLPETLQLGKQYNLKVEELFSDPEDEEAEGDGVLGEISEAELSRLLDANVPLARGCEEESSVPD